MTDDEFGKLKKYIQDHTVSSRKYEVHDISDTYIKIIKDGSFVTYIIEREGIGAREFKIVSAQVAREKFGGEFNYNLSDR